MQFSNRITDLLADVRREFFATLGGLAAQYGIGEGAESSSMQAPA